MYFFHEFFMFMNLQVFQKLWLAVAPLANYIFMNHSNKENLTYLYR